MNNLTTTNSAETLQVSTSHQGNGKYFTTLRRIKTITGENGVKFIETNLLEDLLGTFSDHIGTRLSKKNLQEVHEKYVHLVD